MSDAAPDGSNQRRTRGHFANASAPSMAGEGVAEWMPDFENMRCWAPVLADFKVTFDTCQTARWQFQADAGPRIDDESGI